MTSIRTKIRNSIIDLLKNKTIAGPNVFKNQVHNISLTKIPAIIIKDGDETQSPRDIRDNASLRNWNIEIGLIQESVENWDENLDEFSDEVEKLLKSNRTLDGLVTDLRVETMETEFDGSAQKVLARKSLNLNIKFFS